MTSLPPLVLLVALVSLLVFFFVRLHALWIGVSAPPTLLLLKWCDLLIVLRFVPSPVVPLSPYRYQFAHLLRACLHFFAAGLPCYVIRLSLFFARYQFLHFVFDCSLILFLCSSLAPCLAYTFAPFLSSLQLGTFFLSFLTPGLFSSFMPLFLSFTYLYCLWFLGSSPRCRLIFLQQYSPTLPLTLLPICASISFWPVLIQTDHRSVPYRWLCVIVIQIAAMFYSVEYGITTFLNISFKTSGGRVEGADSERHVVPQVILMRHTRAVLPCCGIHCSMLWYIWRSMLKTIACFAFLSTFCSLL